MVMAYTLNGKNCPLVSKTFSYLCIAAFFLASPSTALSAETAQKRFSLTRCIEIAISNSTSARKAENTLKLQGADVLRNYGSFLPRLSTSASYSPYTLTSSYAPVYLGDPITNIKTANKSVDLTLTTSLNLFNGFKDYASLQAALKKEEAAGYSLSRALQTIAFDVTQAYYQVLLNQELLAIARENLLLAQNQMTLTERQFQIGLKSMIDRNQQQADAAESELSVIKAETSLQKSMLELVRRIQIDPLTNFSLEPLDSLNSPRSLKPDPDTLVELAYQRRSDLKGKELEVKASKWQITMAKAAFYPHLDVTFNVSSGGTEYLNQSIVDSPYPTYPPLSDQIANSIGYSVVLNLSWTIFDGFQTRYNVETAKINRINQQYDYDDLKNNILIDIHEAAGEYRSALMQIETAKISLKAAQSAFDGIKRKSELGAVSFIELSMARATLFTARSNLSQATYNLALQKSILDFSTGSIAIPLQPESGIPVK